MKFFHLPIFYLYGQDIDLVAIFVYFVYEVLQNCLQVSLV